LSGNIANVHNPWGTQQLDVRNMLNNEGQGVPEHLKFVQEFPPVGIEIKQELFSGFPTC